MDKDSIVSVETNAAVTAILAEELGRDVAKRASEIKSFEEGSRPYRIKENGDIEICERLSAAPAARRGEVAFYEALSFSRFVKRFVSAQTVIFADAIGRKFTAAMDYHPAGNSSLEASWDQFRAVLPLRHPEDWSAWVAANKTPMDQASFALFLEEHIPQIAEPAGAKLVEIARTLEAKTDVQFESHIREDNGAHRFKYVEDVNASAAGNISIPPEFDLVLQPFEGSKTYGVKARLRYRINQRKLWLWFDLIRVEDVLREAFNDELLKIEGEIGKDTPIFNGPAPAPQVPPKKAADGQE
jgi:uncharacterized protein YfdQ (DUF2303 family)